MCIAILVSKLVAGAFLRGTAVVRQAGAGASAVFLFQSLFGSPPNNVDAYFELDRSARQRWRALRGLLLWPPRRGKLVLVRVFDEYGVVVPVCPLFSRMVSHDRVGGTRFVNSFYRRKPFRLVVTGDAKCQDVAKRVFVGRMVCGLFLGGFTDIVHGVASARADDWHANVLRVFDEAIRLVGAGDGPYCFVANFGRWRDDREAIYATARSRRSSFIFFRRATGLRGVPCL